ncbi:MAG: hypothetical protein K1X53_02215 [Candidatus Sumerlaeaceae bacterium]|nr:hypothetical protein [Candidatus Sumerlaeaceae bacterium]
MSAEGRSEIKWVYRFQRMSAANVVRLTRLAGLVPWYVPGMFGGKKKLTRLYRRYLEATGQKGNPRVLARESVAVRQLLKCAAPLMTGARDAFVKDLVRVEGEEHIRAALAPGRGAVIASAHVGSGGLPAAWLARQGIRVLTVRRKDLQGQEDTEYGKFALFGCEPMYLEWEEAPVAMLKRGIAALKDNAVISFLADGQFGARGADATMFGKSVTVRTGFVEVARMAKVSVVPAFGLADSSGLRIKFCEPISVATPEDVADFPRRFAAIHEAILRENPACLSWRPMERELFDSRKSD